MRESQLRSMWLTFLLCSAILRPFTASQTNSTTKYSQEDDSLDSATMAILVLVYPPSSSSDLSPSGYKIAVSTPGTRIPDRRCLLAADPEIGKIKIPCRRDQRSAWTRRWLANHTTCPVCRARVIDSCRNPIEVERNIPIATAIDPVESAGDRNSASASQSRGDCGRYALKLPDGVKEEIVKAKLKLKRSASCEILTCVSGGGES
ncbi:LOW QUALITY PROTEIN: hypothetical protein V2J09_016675 [Rumex salicifolius]